MFISTFSFFCENVTFHLNFSKIDASVEKLEMCTDLLT